ncbi:profilin-like [Mizuhopecten yessoensis]|uniref:Profilin n=1 Tax=Mizuhopecten yessoensis TaxID=6573 RepID=A0A210PQP0_MIZYE|nr:profilin-like [Mizuhopecten yessoensis]OWF38798.1 Profilin [Mizuhopecten yessoensis]
MSWDSYIDNLRAYSKDNGGGINADRACIIGLEGGAKWTTDGHPNAFKLEQQECADIASAFKSRDFLAFQSNGIYVEGTKYQFLREEDGKTVMAKKKDQGSMTLQASKTAVVIGHCPEGGQQGNLNKAVMAIAEYLESMNM